VLMFWQAAQLQLSCPTQAAKVAAFPLGIMTVLLITAYIESVILAPAGIFAVLLPIVAAVRAEGCMAVQAARRQREAAARALQAHVPSVYSQPVVAILKSRRPMVSSAVVDSV